LPANFNGSLPANFNGSLPANFNGSLPANFNGSLPANFNGSLPANFNGSIPAGMTGSIPNFTGGGGPVGACKVTGVSYTKVEAMPGQTMGFGETMCKALPGAEWVPGGTPVGSRHRTQLLTSVDSRFLRGSSFQKARFPPA
ncbi:MAG: hypothetical protein EBU67_10215, partial [Actinobacteria bacterium]|nr:hypothetical protein [Actinomycetota bacterium]